MNKLKIISSIDSVPLFYLVIISIIVASMCIDAVLLEVFPMLSPSGTALINVILLSVMLIPTFYYTLFRPLSVLQAERKKQNDEMQERNELFSHFIRHAPIFTYINEVKETRSFVVEASDNFQEMLGIHRNNIIGKSMEELFSADFATKVIADDKLVVSQNRVLKIEEQLNGRRYFTNKAPIALGDRKLLAGYSIDITEQKQAEDRLRRAETFARIGHWELSFENKMMYASDGAIQIYGYTQNHLSLDVVQQATLPEYRPILDSAMKDLITKRKPYDVEFKIRNVSNGNIVDVRLKAEYDPEKKIMFGVVQDITDRKLMEDSLRDVYWRLENIIEGSNIGTWEWNVQTGETVFNDRWGEILGYRLDELSPIRIKTWENLVHPDDFKLSSEMLERHITGLMPTYSCECRMKHKQGHWVWIHDSGSVITRTIDGEPLLMFGTHIDITERKKKEEERDQMIAVLQEALEQIKTLKGIVPICANCKKIRDDKGFWEQVEIYVEKNSQAQFSHGICPDCVDLLYPQFAKKIKG